MICDRCGKKSKTPFWTIEMWEFGKEEEHTEEGVLNNMINNMKRKAKTPDKYCLECIKEIKKFIMEV